MENPQLTFATPTIYAGDKSLVNVVIHGTLLNLCYLHLTFQEIIHSWSGNLVSCKNWSMFWLNEGLTMFIERAVVK